MELPAVKTNEPVPLKTRIYSYGADGKETPVEKTLYYPLSYNKGNFVLTLDAMASADLLRSCENDSGAGANRISVADTSLYSITRLMSGGPQDFYVTLQAKRGTTIPAAIPPAPRPTPMWKTACLQKRQQPLRATLPISAICTTCAGRTVGRPARLPTTPSPRRALVPPA